MSNKRLLDNNKVVIEKWIKPPKLVDYSNSRYIAFKGDSLECGFLFPKKYSEHDFYIDDVKMLDAGEMYYGERIFYADRFYSLLTFYSKDDELTAYYIDITLPAILKEDEILISDLKIDFFILPDKKTYLLLDEDELEEAIEKKYFNQSEIDVCLRTTAFIKNALDNNKFDSIFTDFESGKVQDWPIYKKYE